jgi:hypothetical protein
MLINPINGDIYVTYHTYKCDIWSSSVYTSSPTQTINTSGNTFELTYNDIENNIYITQDDNNVIVISGSSRTLLSTYSIS